MEDPVTGGIPPILETGLDENRSPSSSSAVLTSPPLPLPTWPGLPIPPVPSRTSMFWSRLQTTPSPVCPPLTPPLPCLSLPEAQGDLLLPQLQHGAPGGDGEPSGSAIKVSGGFRSRRSFPACHHHLRPLSLLLPLPVPHPTTPHPQPCHSLCPQALVSLRPHLPAPLSGPLPSLTFLSSCLQVRGLHWVGCKMPLGLSPCLVTALWRH